MQMKHMMDSFEAQKKKNGKKKINVDKRNKNGTRMKMKTRSELKK